MPKIELTLLEEQAKKLQKLAHDPKVIEEFLIRTLRKIALLFLREVIKLTPVDTGYLRRGWLLQEGTEEPSVAEIQDFINNIKVTKKGKTYSVTLANNVEYAVYVNYGHSQEVGRFVPQIGKRLKEGWVEGQFFLEQAEAYIKSNKDKWLEQELNNFLKEYL